MLEAVAIAVESFFGGVSFQGIMALLHFPFVIFPFHYHLLNVSCCPDLDLKIFV